MPRFTYSPPVQESSEDAETVRFEDVRHVLREMEGEQAARKITENVGDGETFSPRLAVAIPTTPTNPGAPPRSKLVRPDAYEEWAATPGSPVRRVYPGHERPWWKQVTAYVHSLFFTTEPARRRPSLQ
jgi:hypothetical protein